MSHLSLTCINVMYTLHCCIIMLTKNTTCADNFSRFTKSHHWLAHRLLLCCYPCVPLTHISLLNYIMHITFNRITHRTGPLHQYIITVTCFAHLLCIDASNDQHQCNTWFIGLSAIDTKLQLKQPQPNRKLLAGYFCKLHENILA